MEVTPTPSEEGVKELAGEESGRIDPDRKEEGRGVAETVKGTISKEKERKKGGKVKGKAYLVAQEISADTALAGRLQRDHRWDTVGWHSSYLESS